MNDDFKISWTELLWEGKTINGEFMRGQLFRFWNHYYICNNIPYSCDECKEMDVLPPTVGWWHEMIPSTLKKCEWEYKNSDEQ